MKIVLLGGDARYRRAAAYLEDWGCEARHACAAEECLDADALLAPTQEEALAAPVRPERTLCLTQRGDCALLRERGFRAASLEEDEEYLRANAILTAEGALAAALGGQERALLGSRCLLFGYGRIARTLAHMLAACGARVTVAARPGPSAARASRDGMPRVPVTEPEEALRRAEHVWNTVPAPVLDERLLRLLPEGAELTDLASAPYGFDIEEARALGIRARRLSGLPGKYCPDSAGEVLAEAVLRMAKGKG